MSRDDRSNPTELSPEETLGLLMRHRTGDASATGQLEPLIFEKLRAIAGRCFRGQPSNHTLQPTALVNEAYVKLAGSEESPRNRAHFLGLAAIAMRQILVDHARSKRAAKRSAVCVSLEASDLSAIPQADALDMIALDEALKKLSGLSERYCRIVELRFFGGLTVPDVARVLDISISTVEAEWRNAKAWLSRELSDQTK